MSSGSPSPRALRGFWRPERGAAPHEQLAASKEACLVAVIRFVRRLCRDHPCLDLLKLLEITQEHSNPEECTRRTC